MCKILNPLVFLFVSLILVQAAVADRAERSALPRSNPLLNNSERCPSLDLRKNFGKNVDQNDLSLCWAFTGAALLEERLCISDPKQCGKAVSPFSAARCSIEGYTVGSHIDRATKCGLEQGICSEEDAPYLEGTKRFLGLLTEGGKDKVEQLKKFYRQWSHAQVEEFCVSVSDSNIDLKQGGDSVHLPQNIKKLVSDFTDIWSEIRKNQPKSPEVDVVKALQKSFEAKKQGKNPELAFINSILIPDTCLNNLKKIPSNLQTWYFNYYDRKKEDLELTMQKNIATVLNMGISLGAELCTSEANRNNCKDADHALVINGMKMENGKCLVHLRNTWDGDTRFEGWKAADEVLPRVYLLNFIAQ